MANYPTNNDDIILGTDTAVHATSDKGVWVDLFENLGKWGDAAGDTFRSIENFVGSKYDDDITGDDFDYVLWGQSGDEKPPAGRQGVSEYAGSGGEKKRGAFWEPEVFRLRSCQDASAVKRTRRARKGFNGRPNNFSTAIPAGADAALSAAR